MSCTVSFRAFVRAYDKLTGTCLTLSGLQYDEDTNMFNLQFLFR